MFRGQVVRCLMFWDGFWGVSTCVNCVINKVPPVDFTSQVSQLKPLYHWWDLRFFTPPESMGKRSAGSFWQIAFTISTWWKNRRWLRGALLFNEESEPKHGLLGDLNPYDISVKLELLCKTVLKKLDRNESPAHKFGCKYQNGSREKHVCSKMSFETPRFVPCHSPNNSIFVLLPNAQFFGESLPNPKISVDTVDKQKSCQSADITKKHLTIYINLQQIKARSISHAIPSQELTYPFSKALLKMIFSFSQGGVC